MTKSVNSIGNSPELGKRLTNTQISLWALQPGALSLLAVQDLADFTLPPCSRPFEAIFQFPGEESLTTSHRVDGLAFLNDDVVGEYKHSSTIPKTVAHFSMCRVKPA